MADRLLVRKGYLRADPDALFTALDNAHRSLPADKGKTLTGRSGAYALEHFFFYPNIIKIRKRKNKKSLVNLFLIWYNKH